MIKAFNSLKGILAIMIFVHHLDLYRGGGSLAVAVFFVLGGFLSTLGYRDRIFSPDFSYKDYMIGKFIKFYPMHWLLLVSAIPFMSLSMSSVVENLCLFGINASLLQSWIPIKSIYFSGNAVSWYLSDTLALVAVFPFLLRWMLNGSKKSKVMVSISIILAYVVLWVFVPHEYTHRFFYINPIFRLVDYMVGMAAALYYLNVKNMESVMNITENKTILLHILSLVSFVGLLALSELDEYLVLHSVIYMPLVCTLLISIALSGGGCLRMHILQSFGSISFAFFLVHQICIRYLQAILSKFGYDSIYILATLAFIITAFVSYFLTYTFDNKISSWLKRKLLNRQSMTVQS